MARRKAPPSRTTRLIVLLESGLGRVLVRVTLAALVFLLAGIVMRQARAYTYRLKEFRVSPADVELVDLPRWADERVHWALQARFLGSFSVSIYSPQAESIVRASVLHHPMVRRVEDVQLLYPRRARMRPVLRVPVARVAVWEDDDRRGQVRRWHLLSDDGCILPKSPYKAYLDQLPYPLPSITGITEPIPREHGEIWEDRMGRVKEAVAAADLAARIYAAFGGSRFVTRIDVSRFTPTGRWRTDGEVRLTISCPPRRPGGTRVDRSVEWGRTERAAADVPGEPSFETKLAWLRNAFATGRAGRVWDVRVH